jgi:hypothetical protein
MGVGTLVIYSVHVLREPFLSLRMSYTQVVTHEPAPDRIFSISERYSIQSTSVV